MSFVVLLLPFCIYKFTTKSAFLDRQLPIEHSDINENASQGRLCVVQWGTRIGWEIDGWPRELTITWQPIHILVHRLNCKRQPFHACTIDAIGELHSDTIKPRRFGFTTFLKVTKFSIVYVSLLILYLDILGGFFRRWNHLFQWK